MAEPFSTVQLLLLSAGLALFGVACLQDWAMRLVPNRVPAAIAILGLALRLDDGTLPMGLFAAFLVFSIAALCWRRGWLGGADVKLFGAGALLVSPAAVLGFVLASCLAGGALALGYAVLAHFAPPPAPQRPATYLRRYLRVEQRRLQRRGPLPYATAIAAGATFVLLGG
ncbi:prepilin peptidase [Acidisphaera sp. L21]|jgi:prepilin peptidase CpaA|uniref:A24 family peptidase n=1 Tax=Acidisphaera sp. L21 TaxID=1641851 RepID=UPI00131D6B18|nr:A24 family peptidase [Acidisphaera sp. L21]